MDKAAAPLMVLLVILGGCAGDDAPGGQVVRDSAGVRVVESDGPVWPGGAGWVLSAEPRLTIGVQDGAPEYQFFRLNDATMLPDGTLVVSNGGSGELRFYDAAGRFTSAAGGQGGGPGEFHRFSTLRICPAADGTLRVDDGGNGRVDLYSAAGEHLGTVSLLPAAGGRPPGITGCAGDAGLLGMEWPDGGVLRGSPGETISGSYRYVVVAADGAVASTIAEVPARTRYVNEAGGSIHYPYVPFVPEPLITAGSGRAFLSGSGGWAVEARDLSGRLVGLYRWSGSGRHAVSSVWGRYREESLAAIRDENQRRRYATFYARDLPLPDSTPALRALHLDREGHVWAERYRLPWDKGSAWDILDPAGRWLGTVALPELRLQPLEIGADHMIARHVDELGVERLLVYGIDRGAAAAGPLR